jgi:predicted DNA-binding protein (MmcQ/YjbR family)
MDLDEAGDAALTGADIQRVATETALALPGAGESEPFGPDVSVFKVCGKMFAMATDGPGLPMATLKCEPEHSEALRQAYPSITPGYHTNKRHWISISAGPGVTAALVAELVTNAYALVVERLPRAQRLLIPESGRARRPGALPPDLPEL